MQLQTRKALSTLRSPATVDVEQRTVQVIAASEAPVKVFTWERGTIDEVILMSGIETPDQIPLLDAHSRYSQKAVLGSARDFRVQGGELHATVQFSGARDAAEAFRKLQEGHLTDFSIGYQPLEKTWIPPGETARINGKSYVGPVQVVTQTQIKELSLVPIGADPNAKARSGRTDMILDENGNPVGQSAPTPNELAARARADERARVVEIQAMCDHFGLTELARGFIEGGSTVEQARQAVLDRIMARVDAGGHGFSPSRGYDPDMPRVERIQPGRDASEKRRDAIVDGLVMRSGMLIEKPAPGANEYAAVSFLDLARECLQAAGETTRGLPPDKIIRMALQQRAQMTADFPSLMANVAGKVLRLAYEQTPATWMLWCKTGSVRDFKEQSRPILSELSDLDEVPEGTKYGHGEAIDGKEVFSIATYGKLWAITRQALINDDLGALTDIPRAWGASAQRKITAIVYAILTGNPTMSDGKALFHSDHGNIGSSGAPSEATLSEARKLMRVQKAPQGLATLNIVPKYLIHPASIETTVDKLLNSTSLDEANSGIVNPFRGKLVPVCEPLLDATDTSDWFLAADQASIDTVEVAFLNGQQGPYIESREGWNVDGLEIKCRIDVGAKALDWRGLVFNEGGA